MKVEHHPCKGCVLHTTAKTICIRPHIGNNPVLAIFFDSPNKEEDQRHKFGVGDAFKMVEWLLARMSISLDNVLISHVLRCHCGNKQLTKKAERSEALVACRTHRFDLLQTHQPLAVVAMGRFACEAFTNGADVGKREGTHWSCTESEIKDVCSRVWVTYSPLYARESPTETVTLSRVLWRAAESAGLKPKTNLNVKPFDYET